MREETETFENLTFILGGARSGKSTYAERLAAETGSRVLYVATADIYDEEMGRRVAIHQKRRPSTWQTLEATHGTADALTLRLATQHGEQVYEAVLLDCIALLTSNLLLMLPENTDETSGWTVVRTELESILNSVRAFPQTRWLVVSNEVGQGVVPAYPLGRLYRDVLGRANQFLAARAGTVYWMVAGLAQKLK